MAKITVLTCFSLVLYEDWLYIRHMIHSIAQILQQIKYCYKRSEVTLSLNSLEFMTNVLKHSLQF